MEIKISVKKNTIYFLAVAVFFILALGFVMSFKDPWPRNTQGSSSVMGHTPNELIPPEFKMTNGVIHTKEKQAAAIHAEAAKNCVRMNSHICTNHEYGQAGIGKNGYDLENTDRCVHDCTPVTRNKNQFANPSLCRSLKEYDGLTDEEKTPAYISSLNTQIKNTICSAENTFWDGSVGWNNKLDSCTPGSYSNSIGKLVEAGVHCIFTDSENQVNNLNGYVMCGVVGMKDNGGDDCGARNTETRSYYCCI